MWRWPRLYHSFQILQLAYNNSAFKIWQIHHVWSKMIFVGFGPKMIFVRFSNFVNESSQMLDFDQNCVISIDLRFKFWPNFVRFWSKMCDLDQILFDFDQKMCGFVRFGPNFDHILMAARIKWSKLRGADKNVGRNPRFSKSPF